jgi:formylglycine-generating enzyme
MFRKSSTVELVLLTVLGSLALATAQEPKQAGGEKQIAVDLGGGVKLKMVLIPAGEFMMGNGESAKATAAFFTGKPHGEYLTVRHFQDEQPQHRVRIAQPFHLGMYHVTRGQFRQFVNDTGYKTDAEKGEKPGAMGWHIEKGIAFNEKWSWRNAAFEQTDEHPVVNVSWNDAVAFCKWLSRKEGHTYRLPTEAEWEYACRAGTTTRYYSGDDPETLARVGNVADATLVANWQSDRSLHYYTIKASDGYAFTSPVGSFQPNAFGLYDMHGNAWQWCADWYGAEYYADCAAVLAYSPTGPYSGQARVVRGGSWDTWPSRNRSAQRLPARPCYRTDRLGFRVARTQ